MKLSPLVSAAAEVAMFSVALAIPGTGMAYAGMTAGAGSIGGGNQVSVPVNVCGNAVGALPGIAEAGCKGGAAVVSENGHENSDSWTSGSIPCPAAIRSVCL